MWFRLKSFLQFYCDACTVYNIQSPFLYDFVRNVLDTDREYYIFKKLETLRHSFRKSKEIIPIEDYGAGSAYGKKDNEIPLKTIVQTAVSNEKKCRILFNLVNFVNASAVLELGTSAGISSAYLASANRGAKVITLEGNRSLVKTAIRFHNEAGLQNIEILPGKFDDTLSIALNKLSRPDIVFMDGNHRYDATIDYFRKILPYCHSKTIIVLDDIYWSSEMQRAWEEIKGMQEVTLSLDIFDLGFVFFNQELSKENIILIPFWSKPWKVGLFGK